MNKETTARPARSLPRYKTLLCCACVAILLANGFSLLRNLDALKATNALQTQSARVADELQYVNLLVTDAESGVRGYFLSGSDAYLGPVRHAPQEVDREFGKLTTLLADNPSQLKNLAQLRNLVERRIASMQQALDVYRTGGLQDIVAIASAPDNKAHMDEIRLQVVIMTGEQNELLAKRHAEFYHQYHQAVWVGLGINAAAIAVILLFYTGIRRSFGLRLRAEQALQQANDQLETTVALRTEQLSVLSRHLIRVAEEEKSRLARELHDEMGANLTAIGMDLATVRDRLERSEPELAAMLARARVTLVDTVQLKRRIIENLRPSLLDNMGLSAALHSYGGDYARVTGIECDVLIEGEVDAVAPMQAIALFRITQEALNNVAKYAQARHVTVHLVREEKALSLLVEDDGIGIAPDALARPKSHGLLGMRERALLLGGSLKVERGAGGTGTCVSAWIPVAASDGENGGKARPAPQGRLPEVLEKPVEHTAFVDNGTAAPAPAQRANGAALR
ncbi:CHASE3 domain-containing protein [Massilia horti]|uniref:Histidine kinase n=1 Tax=Massilia horti TaxID=2562153 RepID=A0A4Y9T4F6_9BURK|nr:CHASE3 domain-containing protein [Massilia horti]TFW33139.1 histidine kinase [Massilia horti]